MKAALFAVAALLLASPAFATLGDNGMTTYEGRTRSPDTLVFGNQLVIDQAVGATLDLTKQVLTGTYQPQRNEAATEKKEVPLECLNSIAPPPLNWHMWCPGKDAKVLGWVDKSGANHRQITLRPQRNMTSTMITWFITTHVLGLLPPVVEFQGNKYYYYHLWHPLDHVEAAWSLGPVNPLFQKGPPLYTLIHERYRQPESWKSSRHYETNGWFFVQDSIMNLMKNRYVITMPLLGLPTWTMIIEFNDTPEGLVVDIEVVAGIPSKGYDERNPIDGFVTAAGMNEVLTAPLLASQRNSPDWEGSIDAITRHAIEEFSNLQFFVPTLWQKYTVMGAKGINWIPTLGTWMQYNNKTALDMQTVSFYNALSALARKQINTASTPKGALVNMTVEAARQSYAQKTQLAEAVVEAKSKMTYVPVSNAVTNAAYNRNKANGAHPEQDIGLNTVVDAVKAVKGAAAGSLTASADTTGNPSAPPVAVANPSAPESTSSIPTKTITIKIPGIGSWFGGKKTSN